MKLPSLHKGYWIYQSPRIAVIVAYLYAQGASPKYVASVVEEHVRYVARLRHSREKGWIVERLEGLGYEPKRRWAKEVKKLIEPEIAHYYFDKLGMDSSRMGELVEVLRGILSVLRARDPLRAVAYLPPTLTLPEKVMLLSSLSRSRYFDLETALRVVVEAWLRNTDPVQLLEGEINDRRKQFRFRFTYLTSLNLVAGPRSIPRPTSLGMIVIEAVERGADAVAAYTRFMRETGRLVPSILLDMVSMDIATKEMFEKYTELVAKTLQRYGIETHHKELLTMLHEEVAYLPLDLPGAIAVAISKYLPSLLRAVES